MKPQNYAQVRQEFERAFIQINTNASATNSIVSTILDFLVS